MKSIFLLLAGLQAAVFTFTLSAQELEPKPEDPAFAKFEPRKAPAAGKLLLEKGDRLAICGDSITEQKMYSRAMETYLTVCTPELARKTIASPSFTSPVIRRCFGAMRPIACSRLRTPKPFSAAPK